MITYNVTDISAPTQLFATYGSQAYLTEMSVDGGEFITPEATYQFDSIGEHNVAYKIDNSFNSIKAPLFIHPTITKIIIGDNVTNIREAEFAV